VAEVDQRIGALHRLAVATREKADPETLALYLEGSGRYATVDVVLACRRLEGRVAWFPKLAELLSECDVVQAERWERDQASRALPAADGGPTFRCRQCLDSGWISLECPEVLCSRPKAHGPHTFAVRCPCWLRSNAEKIRSASEKSRAGGRGEADLADLVAAVLNGTYRFAKHVTVQARPSRAGAA
jgi:hypothetical protein